MHTRVFPRLARFGDAGRWLLMGPGYWNFFTDRTFFPFFFLFFSIIDACQHPNDARSATREIMRKREKRSVRHDSLIGTK